MILIYIRREEEGGVAVSLAINESRNLLDIQFPFVRLPYLFVPKFI